MCQVIGSGCASYSCGGLVTGTCVVFLLCCESWEKLQMWSLLISGYKALVPETVHTHKSLKYCSTRILVSSVRNTLTFFKSRFLTMYICKNLSSNDTLSWCLRETAIVVTTTASLDYFALCGGLCFVNGSSLWCGKEGMFGQIRPLGNSAVF